MKHEDLKKFVLLPTSFKTLYKTYTPPLDAMKLLRMASLLSIDQGSLKKYIRLQVSGCNRAKECCIS